MGLKMPDNVKFILDRLHQNGYQAYIVGGCVRDSKLGIEPHDWDICTSALPEQIQLAFSDYEIIPTGIKHGTVTVIIDGEQYEITTYRIDGEYKDSRHPENVEFVDKIEFDLARRDFTINAMAYNPEVGFVDLFGGQEDLANKIIRCVGNPEERFSEDALRILRAVRFAARFDFHIELNTLKAMYSQMDLLKNISVERVFDEINKTLIVEDINREAFTTFCAMLEVVIPEMDELYYSNAFTYISRAKFKDYDVVDLLYIRLALLFDFDTPLIIDILRRLKASNELINTVMIISKYGNKILNDDEWQDGHSYYERKLLNSIGVKRAFLSIDFAICKVKNNRELVALRNRVLIASKQDTYSLSALAINGNDLLAAGVPNGKEVGVMLQSLLDKVMGDRVENTYDSLIKEVSKCSYLYNNK